MTRQLPLSFVMVALAIAACSHPDTAAPSATLDGDASPVTVDANAPRRSSDAGADAAPVDAQPVVDAGTPSESWSEAAAVRDARDHHATFVVQGQTGAFLYVAGGRQVGQPAKPSKGLTSVERAAIAADGSLSAWTSAGEISGYMAGSAVAQHGNVVALISGIDGGKSSARTLVGLVSPSGDIAWTEGPPLSGPRFHATAAVVGKYVFVFGGFPDNAVFLGTNVVERAEFTATGLSAWQTVAALPAPRTHQATVAVGENIFMLGGSTTGPYQLQKTILRTTVLGSGELSPWTPVGSLPATRNTHAATVVGNKMYVIGGMNNVESMKVQEDVIVADIATDNTLGPFRTVAKMPVARMHMHHAPFFGETIYMIAGTVHDHATGKEISQNRSDLLHIP